MSESLKLNDVFKNIDDNDFGLYRVLWVNRIKNILIAIMVPTGDAAAKWYRNGPKKFRLNAVEEMLNNRKLVKVRLKPEAVVLMSDDVIQRRFPNGNDGEVPTLIRIRDASWNMISPLLDEYNNEEIFEKGLLSSWIIRRAQELKIGQNRIYNALHRFWIGGSHKNSLMPNTQVCGKRKDGKPKEYSKKPGKKNALVKKGEIDKEGLILTEEDKKNLQAGWRYFVKPYKTVREAYLLTSAIWWNDGVKIVDGKEQPILLPSHMRPTESQFRYRGPQGDCEKEAWRQLLLPGDYERNKRGLTGTTRDGIVGVGQVGFADATPSDQHLVSILDRLKLVGRENRLILQDGFCEVIAGFYAGFANPSGRIAMLTVLSGASSKQKQVERYGIEYKEEEWPEIFFCKVHADNGEYRNELAKETMKDLHSSLEYIPSGRADRNKSESGHKVLHRLVDHRNYGSTHGRGKKRGEDDAGLHACWTHWEYNRELLRAIYYYNNKADASHLLTIEMKRDGVKPNRVAIYHWAVEQGYYVSQSHDIDLLRTKLLPKMKAVVRENGVFLLRNDTGRKKVVIPRARYVSDYILEQGWLERARRNGNFEIDIYYHPKDISNIWYTDDSGLHELDNMTNDNIINIEGTLEDLVYLHDLDLYDKCSRKGESDQDQLDFVWGRESTNENAKKQKQNAIKKQDRKVTKKELCSDIKENRINECKLMTSNVIHIDTATKIKNNANKESVINSRKEAEQLDVFKQALNDLKNNDE